VCARRDAIARLPSPRRPLLPCNCAFAPLPQQTPLSLSPRIASLEVRKETRCRHDPGVRAPRKSSGSLPHVRRRRRPSNGSFLHPLSDSLPRCPVLVDRPPRVSALPLWLVVTSSRGGPVLGAVLSSGGLF
jgi:hypothetical protein